MDKLQAQLAGNTLRVYVYAMKNGKVGVREVQRALGFADASLAQYHINKLTEMGLLRDAGGQYEVAAEVKVDVLRDFLKIGKLLVPRFIFYGMFFTIFTVFLGLIAFQSYANQPIEVWFAALLGISSAIYWYEATRAWKSTP